MCVSMAAAAFSGTILYTGRRTHPEHGPVEVLGYQPPSTRAARSWSAASTTPTRAAAVPCCSGTARPIRPSCWGERVEYPASVSPALRAFLPGSVIGTYVDGPLPNGDFALPHEALLAADLAALHRRAPA